MSRVRPDLAYAVLIDLGVKKKSNSQWGELGEASTACMSYVFGHAVDIAKTLDPQVQLAIDGGEILGQLLRLKYGITDLDVLPSMTAMTAQFMRELSEKIENLLAVPLEALSDYPLVREVFRYLVQTQIGDPAILDKLAAWLAPRFVDRVAA